jgi:Iap family predicted aminopeptidase
MKGFLFPSLIIAILLPLPSAASHARQGSESRVSTLEQTQEDLQKIPCQPKKRLNAVRDLFAKMGATSSDASVEKSGGAKNYVVRREGTGPGVIVIGAHYDFVKEGCGAIDNWTGIVVVAHMYRTISHMKPAKTVLFVAFDQEERGRVGSRAMVLSLLKTGKSNYCAMLNFDSFGMGKPFAIQGESSLKLVHLGVELADGMQVPFSQKEISGFSDALSFQKQGIPAITLSGLSDGWAGILHTYKDQQNAIDTASVFVGYRLGVSMWSSIDAAPCDSYREHP